MEVNAILNLSRLQTHTNDTQMPNATLIDYLNIIYWKVANRIITSIDEDFFWDEFLTDSVVWQNEYVMEIADSTTPWMKKIQRVEMKWASTDTYNTLVWVDTLSNYPTSVGDLNTNLSTEQAFYDIKDGSLFIYPSPSEVVANWIKVQAVITLVDLAVDWLENTIFPTNQELREYHYLLATWIKQYIYSSQWLINEKNDAINEFETELNRVIETIKDRTFAPVVAELPNTSLWY